MSIFSYVGCELNNKYYLEDTYYPKQRSLKTTEEIWNKSYPEEKMNIENFGEDVNLDIRYEQKSQYDLVAAAERQREFYYNVALPHYRDKLFLLNGIDRYRSNC